MKSVDDYINNVKFSRNKVRLRYSASLDPLIGCCRVQWCTMTFSGSKNNTGPMNNCVHLNTKTINTNYNWHIVQAIFDATNTTRERRATVYERIVHQHGLKCMFLESICNRWVKSILQPKYVFRTIKQMFSLFSREKKMYVSPMVFWLTSSQKCGQSGEWKLPKWTSLDFHEIAHRALFKTVGNNSVL